MYLTVLLSTLVLGSFAEDPTLPNNEWIHTLGKKNVHLDPKLDPLYDPIPIIFNLTNLLQLNGKRTTDSEVVKAFFIHDYIPLTVDQIFLDTFPTGNKKRVDSLVRPLDILFPSGQNQLWSVIASKRNLLSSIILPFTDGGILPNNPLLIASKKRRQSIIAPTDILGLPTQHSLIDLILSKRNLESIVRPIDLGIIPFNPNLIASKKRRVVFDPLINNPLIISKKDNIWNPLIDILLPPIKDFE